MEIVEFSADEVVAAAGELAQLLLDSFYEAVGWSRLGTLPAYSARPDGTLAGSAFYFLEL